MKTLFLSIVSITFFFVIACQDNSSLNPVSPEQSNNLNREISHQYNVIKFEKLLVDPSVPFTNYLSIAGTVEYSHRFVYPEKTKPSPQKYVNLTLKMNAEIKDPGSPLDVLWIVTGKSEDLIYLSGDGLFVLKKNYQIEGRDDGMSLITKFLVTNDGVSLSSMWFEMNVDNKFNKNIVRDTITYPPVQITRFE